MIQSEFWDKRSESYDSNIREESFFTATIEKITKLVQPSDVVLDLGCATGEMSIELAKSVQSLHGIDTSDAMIQKAKSKAFKSSLSNLEFSCLEIFDSRLCPKRFNVILALNVLHLMDDLDKVLRRISELLEEDGVLIIETPCLGERNWFFRVFIKAFVKLGVSPPILELTYESHKRLLQNNCLELVAEEILDVQAKQIWLVAKKKTRLPLMEQPRVNNQSNGPDSSP